MIRYMYKFKLNVNVVKYGTIITHDSEWYMYTFTHIPYSEFFVQLVICTKLKLNDI